MTSCTLLLVDDEPDLLDALAQRLRVRGLKADTACSGEEALKRLKFAPEIDAVLLDIAMPGLDGLHTVAAIKKFYPLVEVIMLTGDDTVYSAITSLQHGAFDYLIKPVDLEELLSKVERAVARRKSRQNQILDARMKPYLSSRERDKLISEILLK